MTRRLPAALLLATVLTGSLASAQAQRSGDADAIALARRQAQEALNRSKQLERQARSATDEAARARADASALAARIEAAEADITAAETQVRLIERLRAEQQARLAATQEPVARLVAALQTMGRRPSALALVQPGTLDNMIHVRALLASTLPVVRERSAVLRQELEARDRLRVRAEHAVAELRASREALRSRVADLSRFEADQRRRSQGFAESALFQSDRALALTEEIRDISAEASNRQYQALVGRELAELPGPILRPTRSGRPAPAAGPRFRVPVKGELVTGTGEISSGGVHSRGLTFTTGGNAPVIAPADGRILYAGPFRSYGSVVIISHGRDWTSVITHLARVEVAVGNRVRVGDPLGRSAPGQLSVEVRHQGRAVSIAPLLSPG